MSFAISRSSGNTHSKIAYNKEWRGWGMIRGCDKGEGGVITIELSCDWVMRYNSGKIIMGIYPSISQLSIIGD